MWVSPWQSSLGFKAILFTLAYRNSTINSEGVFYVSKFAISWCNSQRNWLLYNLVTN